MKLTPEEAKAMRCPVARTFAEKHSHNCEADACILWRWLPLMMDKEQVAARKKLAQEMAEEAGERNGVKWANKAADAVAKDPAKYGLPTGPTHGYCGLGGKPE